MRNPVREQVESEETRDLYASLDVIDCSTDRDVARQEFKADADIGTLLKRYGAVPPPPPMGGEFDFDWDLQSSLNAIRAVVDGYHRIPEPVKAKYRSVGEIIEAAMQGVDVFKVDDPAAGSSGAGAAASPSEARQEGVLDKAFREWLKGEPAVKEGKPDA